MNFTKVPKQIQKEIEKLVVDEQFQRRFAEDKVLDQLDELKYDPFLQYNQLQAIIHNNFKMYGNGFKPITLALWCFLYTIKSPIIFNKNIISDIDIDVFFYLLQTKDFRSSMQTILKNSTNYCKSVLQLTNQQIVQVFQKMLKFSFRVLNMFPSYNIEGYKPVFNVDWLTSIATKVCQVSNYNIQQVYNQISICEAYYLFAQYCREKGSEAIYLRTEEEIMQEQDLRSTELVVERLIELKVIEQKDKQFYINMIHNMQEKQ